MRGTSRSRLARVVILVLTPFVLASCIDDCEGGSVDPPRKLVVSPANRDARPGARFALEAELRADGSTSGEPATGTRWDLDASAGKSEVDYEGQDKGASLVITIPRSFGTGHIKVTARNGKKVAVANIWVKEGTASTTSKTETVMRYEEPEGEHAPEEMIFDNGNVGGVENGGRPARFTIRRRMHITSLFTYHWNDERGVPSAGTMTIATAGGDVIGTYDAIGDNGDGGPPNIYWTATPDVTLEPGTYVVTNSSAGTWSTNAEAGGVGMLRVKGYPVDG